MKVVYLTPSGELGGGERSLLDLLAAQRSARELIDASLVVCADGPLVTEARALGVDVSVVPMPDALATAGEAGGILSAIAKALCVAPDARKYAKVLGAAIRASNADLIHSNGIKTHLLTRLAGLEDLPVIWHVRDFISSRPITRRLLRQAATPNVTIVANSGATAADASSCLSRRGRPVAVHVVCNGIDTDEFSPGPADAAALDALAGLPPPPQDVVRVGLVATYARWKGHELFIQAAAKACQSSPDSSLRFYMIGGPIYRTGGSQCTRAELELLSRRAGVDDRVGFVPFQTKPAAIYRALDIVVHASTKPEPFGRTIVEAMSCGRAVIVSNSGGAKELFDDGVDAIAAASGDVGAFAAAIGLLAGDSRLRAKLGGAGRETVLKRFDRRHMVAEISRLQVKLGKEWQPGRRQKQDSA